MDFKNVRILMLLNGIKQSDVARVAKCDRAFICRILSGQQKASKKAISAFEKFGLVDLGEKNAE